MNSQLLLSKMKALMDIMTSNIRLIETRISPLTPTAIAEDESYFFVLPPVLKLIALTLDGKERNQMNNIIKLVV